MQTSPISRVIVVRNKLGLHIRPWTQFARLAGKFESRVEILHLGRRVDSRSPIDLLTLAAVEGTQLTLEAQGPDAQQAIEALADLVENVFPREDIEHEERPGED
jgi:phosphotransferase system HPr (HPr) family protein